MLRKIYRTGNSLVIPLPKESLDLLALQEGSEVLVILDESGSRLIIEPVHPIVPGVNAEFAAQLDAFIDQYRPALEALARCT